MPALATLLAALLLPAFLSAQPGRFGLPACARPESELADRSFFVLCHDSSLKVPLWTAHELKPGQTGGHAARPRRFGTDVSLAGPAARNADYRGSGYSRGHMVPAEDLAWSDASIRATFVLSNAVPQRQSVNGGKWRQLEAAVRGLAASSDAVHVFTGPVFAAAEIERIGEGRVAVPTHTFKVVLALVGASKIMFAAILPNGATGDESLERFFVTVDAVERLTGLDFFSALDDEEEGRLESAAP